MEARRGITGVLAALSLAAGACQRPPYPAPEAPVRAPLASPTPTARDQGDEAAIRALEQQCRVRLSGDTAEASLAALDRVREVVGTGCDLTAVQGDPLHWLLRCRSDALFASGHYELSEQRRACAELGGARVGSWECFGSVLSSLLAAEDGGAIARLSLAVLGHVDHQPLKPGSSSHLCTELHERLGYRSEARWEPLALDAEPEERRFANHQLAFCRAASVAERIDAGLTRGRSRAAKRPADGAEDAAPQVELAVVGMGTAWLASQPEGRCPSHGLSEDEEPACPDARRVDLLVRFTPRVDRLEAGCADAGEGAIGALHCLQRCMERAAAGMTRDVVTHAARAELFEPGPDNATALPVGWYLHRKPALEGRRLSLSQICQTLAISDDHCRTR